MDDIPENLKHVCRLCWNYDLSLHWEDDIDENGSLSYKDCFYKYSRFENIVIEELSEFLCADCSNKISNFHLLVEKSAKILRHCQKQQQQLELPPNENGLSDNGSDDGDAEGSNAEYECQEINEIEIVREDIEYVKCLETVDTFGSTSPSEHLPDSTEDNDGVLSKDSESLFSCDAVEDESCSENSSNVCPRVNEPVAKHIETFSIEIDATQDRNDEKPSKKNGKKTGMCSYCSKIVSGIYYLKQHEQTHEENRQRDVVCPKCNVKLYDKRSLYTHMRIHDENRVKKYKCEFCDKAFFSRGACNVHRRIHLGLMFHCQLCPKQFFRQLDLDRHMPQHSHETLNSINRKQPQKYYVHCKECDRKIASNRFNGHQATHLNNPFMRCTLCEKDFCTRRSGGKHMASVHKRRGGEYDDITFYYKSKETPRLSLLLKQQQEDVEPAE